MEPNLKSLHAVEVMAGRRLKKWEVKMLPEAEGGRWSDREPPNTAFAKSMARY